MLPVALNLLIFSLIHFEDNCGSFRQHDIQSGPFIVPFLPLAAIKSMLNRILASAIAYMALRFNTVLPNEILRIPSTHNESCCGQCLSPVWGKVEYQLLPKLAVGPALFRRCRTKGKKVVSE